MSWYVLQCRPGREGEITASLKNHLSGEALEEAFLYITVKMYPCSGGTDTGSPEL